jgi:hypothetical protein
MTTMRNAPASYGAWLSAARHSEFATRTGVPGHRDFYQAGFRFGWPIAAAAFYPFVHASYFIDLLPVTLSTRMPDYAWDSQCRTGILCPGATPIPHTAYAIGVAPIGLALSLGGDRARFVLEASGGGLWFSRAVPDPEATRFNFTAMVGPGVELSLGPERQLRLGYLLHHTSNGGRGRVNPGLNSEVLSVGISWSAAHRRER